MATDNVTPIQPGAEPPPPPPPAGPEVGSDTPAERHELASNLMVQAVRAAILLIDNDEQPGLAADVLCLARDRWDSVWGVP
jgi:hypothetical protein